MQGEDVYGKEQLPVFSERMSEDFSLSLQVRVLWAKTGGGEERNRWSALYVHMGDSEIHASASRKTMLLDFGPEIRS